ncbi:hypothetical protein [Sphingomonas sp. BK235]|uniref:hypothetical protein n=1 Tax=Sphingomonas sp. BK235 TaxID=2512131 RepID=UPI001404D0A6|nr:hypothetical protein [Sphingomonas sp. BK235]
MPTTMLSDEPAFRAFCAAHVARRDGRAGLRRLARSAAHGGSAARGFAPVIVFS